MNHPRTAPRDNPAAADTVSTDTAKPDSVAKKLKSNRRSLGALIQQVTRIFADKPASQVGSALAPLIPQIQAHLTPESIDLPTPEQEALQLAISVSQLQIPSRAFLKKARDETNNIEVRDQLRHTLETYDDVLMSLGHLQALVTALAQPALKTLLGLLSTHTHYYRKRTVDALTLGGHESSWRYQYAFSRDKQEDAEIEKSLSYAYRILDMLAAERPIELANLARAVERLHTTLGQYLPATLQLKNTVDISGIPPTIHAFAGTRAIAIIAVAHARAYLVPRLQSLSARLGLALELPTDETLQDRSFDAVKQLPSDAASLATSLQYWIDRTPIFMGSHAVIRIQALLSQLGETAVSTNDESRQLTLVKNAPPTSKSNEEFLRYYDALGHPMPLQPCPDQLKAVEAQLMLESPWMKAIIKRMFSAIRGHLAQGEAANSALLPPILLVGSPGCGKTYYLQRLAELMNLQYTLIPMGGMHDSMTLRGSPRGWSSTRPGLFVQTLEQKRIANPLFILDELEKVGDSRHNGNPYDVLLQVLEPQNARMFYDECLQVNVDLSHLILLATANSIEGIPEPVRDRFVVLNVNDPTPADLEVMARQLWNSEMSRYGYAAPLMPQYPEVIMQERLARSPSLRRVVSAVKKVVAATINVQMEGGFVH